MKIEMTFEEYKAIAKAMDSNSKIDIPANITKELNDCGDIKVSTTESCITEVLSERFVNELVQLDCIKTLLSELDTMMQDMLKNDEARHELAILADDFNIKN